MIMTKEEYLVFYNKQLKARGDETKRLIMVGDNFTASQLASHRLGYEYAMLKSYVADHCRFMGLDDSGLRALTLENGLMALRGHLYAEVDRNWRNRELPDSLHVFELTFDDCYRFRFMWFS